MNKNAEIDSVECQAAKGVEGMDPSQEKSPKEQSPSGTGRGGGTGQDTDGTGKGSTYPKEQD